MGTQMLELLRIFLVILGILGALWGLYDMMGGGQESSVGVKKLIGGIAFATISGIVMTWAITSVGSAEAKAGVTAAILPHLIHGITLFRI